VITNSFIFLEKISSSKERKLWQQGIKSWDQFLKADNIKGITDPAKKYYDTKLKEASCELYDGNSSYFSRLMPKTEHWRLYDFFKEDAVYLDIETDGLCDNCDVTIVGLFDGFNTKTMIRGMNLNWNELRQELSRYKMIVTFNGSVFDLPFIEKRYGKVIPEIPHCDLRFCCNRIGLNGGLKHIEREIGIQRRDIVENLCGGDAAKLYRMWRCSGDDYYLKLLVEYNEEDVINLKQLADYSYPRLKDSLIQKQ
jgi:uncharacterized protein